jgi:hypothetical protein
VNLPAKAFAASRDPILGLCSWNSACVGAFRAQAIRSVIAADSRASALLRGLMDYRDDSDIDSEPESPDRDALEPPNRAER